MCHSYLHLGHPGEDARRGVEEPDRLGLRDARDHQPDDGAADDVEALGEVEFKGVGQPLRVAMGSEHTFTPPCVSCMPNH